MARFFVSPGQIGPAKISIFDGDVNHIRRVLRMKEGDELTVCDKLPVSISCFIKL